MYDFSCITKFMYLNNHYRYFHCKRTQICNYPWKILFTLVEYVKPRACWCIVVRSIAHVCVVFKFKHPPRLQIRTTWTVIPASNNLCNAVSWPWEWDTGESSTFFCFLCIFFFFFRARRNVDMNTHSFRRVPVAEDSGCMQIAPIMVANAHISPPILSHKMTIVSFQ